MKSNQSKDDKEVLSTTQYPESVAEENVTLENESISTPGNEIYSFKFKFQMHLELLGPAKMRHHSTERLTSRHPFIFKEFFSLKGVKEQIPVNLQLRIDNC